MAMITIHDEDIIYIQVNGRNKEYNGESLAHALEDAQRGDKYITIDGQDYYIPSIKPAIDLYTEAKRIMKVT